MSLLVEQTVSVNGWNRPRQRYGCDGVEASQSEGGGEGWDNIDVASSESVCTVKEWYRFGISVVRSERRGFEKWGMSTYTRLHVRRTGSNLYSDCKELLISRSCSVPNSLQCCSFWSIIPR
jgi:hypothetical protein